MDDQPSRLYVPPPPATPRPTGDEYRPADPPDEAADDHIVAEDLPVRPPLEDVPGTRFPVPPPGAPVRRSRLRGVIWLLVLAAIIGAIVWFVIRAGQQTSTANRFQTGGPSPVGTATVQLGNMPVIDNALGTVTPLATVTVQSQISGYLSEVAFQEGQMVNKGDFLAQIDPRPYQVALEQAQGQLAKDQALLADAELDLARYRKLVAQNSIATQTLDTQVSLVGQDRGTVQSDQAQVDVQKLNLIYCHIIAPTGGLLGLRQLDPGNYVQAGNATGLVVITQMQPMSVIFTLPEDSLPPVLDKVHAGQTLQATALDRSGATKLDTGNLATIDNQIDPTTGTLKLRAVFANASQNLFPNQFVNIQLLVNTLPNVSIVPDSAIQRGAPGTFVYVVKPDNTVTAAPVTLGPDDGTRVAITKGLDPGQVVVTDGADRLKEGAKVTVAAAKPPAAPAQPAAPGQPPAQSSQPPSQPDPTAVPANAPPQPSQPPAQSGQALAPPSQAPVPTKDPTKDPTQGHRRSAQ